MCNHNIQAKRARVLMIFKMTYIQAEFRLLENRETLVRRNTIRLRCGT